MYSKEQSIKDRLRNLSHKTGTLFNELWLALVIERFLFRLSRSKYLRHFIFKGGLLLSQYINLNRATKDLDFLITDLKLNNENLDKILSEISTKNIDDGLEYSILKIEELTHPQIKYNGFRATIKASLGQLKEQFSLDIGYGNPVDSIKKEIFVFPKTENSIFDDKVALLVYPPEFIFAEKLETSVYFGMDNSRMKDYHDMYLIINGNIVDKLKLKRAIIKTFKYRNTEIVSPILNFKPDNRMKTYWRRHYMRTISGILPKNLELVINEINNYTSNILKNKK